MPDLNGLGITYLTDLSPKDASFDVQKAMAKKVAKLYGMKSKTGFTGFICGKRLVDFKSFAVRIEKCGAWLIFKKDLLGCMKLKNGDFCRSPHCPTCQKRRALKWRATFLTLLDKKILSTYPTHRFVFLTLTIRNCGIDDLRPTLTHLNEAFNRLVKLKNFPMVGLIKSIEVTRTWDCYHENTYLGRHGTKWIVKWEYKNQCKLDIEPTDEVHPHIHILGLVPSAYFSRDYIKQAEWVEMWQRCLRVDYKPIVNIQAVKKPKSKKPLPEPEEFSDNPSVEETGLIQGLCETLKYTVKESDLVGSYCTDDSVNSEWLKRMTQQLYKMRKLEYRGVFKEFRKELEEAENSDNLENINDHDEELEGDIIEELTFRWMDALEKYILVIKDVP